MAMKRSSSSGDVKLPTLVKASSAANLGEAVRKQQRPTSTGGAGGGELRRAHSATGLNKRPQSKEERRPQSPPKKQEEKSNVVVVKFSPGDHGLTWDEDKRITGSIMQAWMRGVRAGWTVLAVNGKMMQSDEELADVMQQASGGDSRYEVRFEKCQGNFGTEAKERSDQQKRNRTRLMKTFSFQGSIEKTEYRGVTFEQFQQVLDYSHRYCEGWYDIAPAKVSKTSGHNLSMDFLNFHHLNAWLFEPATKPKKCAMAEMLTNKPQPPEWFISHWWGEPVVAFSESWQAQMATRRLAPECPYWISAFAIKQHSSQSEFTTDPKKSNMYKALEAAKFKMLLIVDESAVVFSRLWCDFEASLLLDQPAAPLDFAILAGSGALGAQVLTHGLTQEEEGMEEKSPGAGSRAKAARESGFPLSVLQAALAINVVQAEASVEVDRERILDCITGRPLKATPLPDHAGYEETTQRLRALFAATLWQFSSLPDLGNTMREQLSKSLRADVTRKSLEIRLAGQDRSGLALLVTSLPPNLKSLCLKLRASGTRDEDLLALAASLPKKVSSLGIDLSHCAAVSDEGLKDFAKKVDFEKVSVDALLLGTQAKKETQDWYAAQALKRQADGNDGMRREVARALGLNICRAPQDCARMKKKVVRAVPLLIQMLEDEETALRMHAFRALEGFGDRVMKDLDETGAAKIQELKTERDARRAQKIADAAEAKAKATAKAAPSPEAKEDADE